MKHNPLAVVFTIDLTSALTLEAEAVPAPDQSIAVDPLDGADHIAATRGDGYLFVYSAQGRKFTLRPGKISGERLKGWWYNPRSGAAEAFGEFDNSQTRELTPPSGGFGSDWALVLDDFAKSFAAPGTPLRQ